MTHEETIKALDGVIVYLNRINTEKDLPYSLVDDITSRIRGMDVSNTTIRAISNIKIESTGSLPQYCSELLHIEQEKQNRNRRSIQSIIEILKVEQERHKRILEEKTQKKSIEIQETAIDEQKKSNVIAHKAYRCSIIATIIAIISLIVAIYK